MVIDILSFRKGSTFVQLKDSECMRNFQYAIFSVSEDWRAHTERIFLILLEEYNIIESDEFFF